MPPTFNIMDPEKLPDEDSYSWPELVGVLVFYFGVGIAVVNLALAILQRTGVL